MKYIIIIDNNKVNCRILCDLLNKKNPSKDKFKIGYWINSNNIENTTQSLINQLRGYYNENDYLHFFVDMLLTEDEEQEIDRIQDKFMHSDGATDTMIPTGISFANELIEFYGEKAEVSFMSKWINLKGDVEIEHFNGIYNNPLWNGRKIKCFFNPINDNHKIINREMSMPKYGASTFVDVVLKVAFGEVEM